MRFSIASLSTCLWATTAVVTITTTATVNAFTSPLRRPVVHSSLSSSSTTTTTTTTTQLHGALNCRPIGIGSAAPRTVIRNVDLESVVDTNDEWISSRTGIHERRVLLHDEKIKDLSTKAARNALEMSGVDPTDIDLVICASSSADDLFGDATTIASNVGCKNAFAFDLVAACSGFLFGAVTAGQFLHNNANHHHSDDDASSTSSGSDVRHALVIGADALSRWVDWDDRNSCILFGDGAGAMVLASTESGKDGDDESARPGILGYSAHSDGEGLHKLQASYCGSPRMVATPGEGTVLSTGKYSPLSMDGREVYKFATREVPRVLKEALEKADIKVEDVDWLLLHQANIRIMETVANRLGMPMDKVITNLSSYGNTSAASIPLALDEAVRKGQVKPGDIIACAGFGAGLSWGAAIFRWG